jgi:hypothetical protein
LLSLLAPFVLSSRRPLLLLPAKLVQKTKREMVALSHHWPIPNWIRLESYELLGRVQSVHLLDRYLPDLIVADEAHKLKNRKAAVTRRVERYMQAHPDTRFVALSGTITKRSLRDYAHILRWIYPPAEAPIPNSWQELEDWAEALDERTDPRAQPVAPGALLSLASPEERKHQPRHAARLAFRRRLVDTLGTVATTEGHTGASLQIAPLYLPGPPDQALEDAFHRLRDAWETPDGWPLTDGMQVWRTARELALGFYYRWTPRPPDSWLQPRRDWARTCRALLADNRRSLDSELAVTRAVDEGHYPGAVQALTRWRAVRDSFQPRTEAVWLTDSVLRLVQRWAHDRQPGIVWVEHIAFGERLASLSGLTYYGRGGTDQSGRMIEQHSRHDPLIASAASNAEGRNLQAWSRNLLVSPPPNGMQWEQILGRTHREGQEADEVTVDVLVTCLEHATAWWQAQADAAYVEASTGQAQKILYADSMMPSANEIASLRGPRWEKPENV